MTPGTVKFTIFLAAAVALGPLSTDMYLSTFPQLARVFSATVSQVQLTLSAYMIGISVCQLIYGPLSDRYGRKYVLLAGMVIFTLASLGCALSASIEFLVAMRFLQAFGACAGMVVTRAIVRDLFERDDAAKQFSRMGTVMGFAPIIAPIIGGYLAVQYGWESIFVIKFVYGLLLSLFILLFLRESLSQRNMQALNTGQLIVNYAGLFKHREYVGYLLTGGFCYGGLFAFISGSAFVIIDVLGHRAEHFGYYFAVPVAGYILGTLIGPAFIVRVGAIRSIRFGTGFLITGGLAMNILAFSGVENVYAIILPMIFFGIGLGIVLPCHRPVRWHRSRKRPARRLDLWDRYRWVWPR